MARNYSKKHPWRRSWQITRSIEGIYRYLHNYYFSRKVQDKKQEERRGPESSLEKPYKTTAPSEND